MLRLVHKPSQVNQMGRFVILFAVTALTLFNYELAYGSRWRSRLVNVEPETPRDRLQRRIALVVTVLTIVAACLIVLAVK